MNPPFGTKKNEGIDMKLLDCALKATTPGGTVYSLHKKSTEPFILKYVTKNHPGCDVDFPTTIQFDLPNSYKFHKKKTAVVEVVLVKIVKGL